MSPQPFHDDELAGMRECNEAHMMDACQLGSRATTQDEAGQPVESYTYGARTACGFSTKGSKVQSGSDREPVLTDASLRLAHGSDVEACDSVRLLARFGVDLPTPEDYDVVGEPIEGAAGIVLALNRTQP